MRATVAARIRAEKVPCPDHPMPLPKPGCWTCGRNGAFERAARIALTGGSTETAAKRSDDPAHTDGPKPYLCGCPSDDPRPCPLHDRDSDDNAQPRVEGYCGDGTVHEPHDHDRLALRCIGHGPDSAAPLSDDPAHTDGA